MSDSIKPSGMDQADYMRVFMQELQYQDPLKPVDNKDFMAQMAQFTALQQATESNLHLVELLKMTASNQALALLNKTITHSGSTNAALVSGLVFENNSLKLRVRDIEKNESMLISLLDITSVDT